MTTHQSTDLIVLVSDDQPGGGTRAADLPEPPDRADDMVVALAELSSLLLDQDSLEQTLQRVVDLAVRTMPGCSWASVTLVAGSRPGTAAHTDQIAYEVDRRQYDVDDGPCLDAARRLRRNCVDVSEAAERWPAFTSRAVELGVLSFLASPLVAGGRGIGALNLYSAQAAGFDRLDESIVDLFSAQASVALANAQVYRSATELATQMSQAMASRAVIEQAKGALMATRGLTEDEAFAALRTRSQRSNRKLRDVALDVLAKP